MEEVGNDKTAPDLPIYHWTKFFYLRPDRRAPQPVAHASENRDYLKYLPSKPKNAEPWRASSLHISWTVSWIAS